MTLSLTNSKTNKTETVRFLPKGEIAQVLYQPSVPLAKDYAATYALHRVCSHKSMHLALPPTFRAYWGELEECRKHDVKHGKTLLYSPNPFDAARSIEAEKERIVSKQSESAPEPRPPPKSWRDAPVAEMSASMRRQIETLVKQHGWTHSGNGLERAATTKIVERLHQLGFRKSHCSESLAWSNNFEECLQWLLVHVPEDDLPERFLPGNYSAGDMSFSNLSGDNLKLEYAVRRLASAGFPVDLCREKLQLSGHDDRGALELLLRDLLSAPLDEDSYKGVPDNSIWDDEVIALESIFGESFKRIDKQSFSIVLDNVPALQMVRIRFTCPLYSSYPNWIPSQVVESEPVLPSYIRLAILRQAGKFALTLRGDAMCFSIIDWLQSNMGNIIQDPGKLRDINMVSKSIELGDCLVSEKRNRSVRHPRSSIDSVQVYHEWLSTRETLKYKQILASRQRLPAWSAQREILDSLAKENVFVISGETGSGKSTQVAQFILDDMIQRHMAANCSIICTQPRRISAISLAERVAEERMLPVGEEIGYSIRGQSRTSDKTKLQFVTTGVLLRRIQTGDVLSGISHVIVDEIHERSVDVDFLLILLKRMSLHSQRHCPKIILMSATLDSDSYLDYFGQGRKLSIEGRTFPVQDVYLDTILLKTAYRNAKFDSEDIMPTIRAMGSKIDYHLLVAATTYLCDTIGAGAILIFLPGTAEIARCRKMLDAPYMHTLPLHASLSPKDQRLVFRPAPMGKRKIICATNVAETSITIEDVVAVIDTGKVKETRFDPMSKMTSLTETWASKAACRQRRGRAGRVREGVCFKMFTRSMEAQMADTQVPEILRVPLEQVCLSVKSMNIHNIGQFLAGALTAPSDLAIDQAMQILIDVGAIRADKLTGLGHHLSMIPADIRCGKLIIYGTILGCFEECLAIASMLSSRPIFFGDKEAVGNARLSFRSAHGDLLSDLKAYQAWLEMRENEPERRVRIWCEENCLSRQTLFEVYSTAEQYRSSLLEAGFSPSVSHCSDTLLSAVIAAGLTPNLARILFPDKKYASLSTGTIVKDPEAKTIKYFTREDNRVFIHPSSILFAEKEYGNASYLAFFTIMQTSKPFIRQITMSNVYAILMFGGPLEVDLLGRGLLVGGFKISAWARIGVLVGRLRSMLDSFLNEKFQNPSLESSTHPLIQLVQLLLDGNGL